MTKGRKTIILIIMVLVIVIVVIEVGYIEQKVELRETKQELEETEQKLAEYKADELDIFPCPFCGSEDVDVVDSYGNGKAYYVKCHNCFGSGPAKNLSTDSWDISKVEAINLWNLSYEKRGNENE